MAAGIGHDARGDDAQNGEDGALVRVLLGAQNASL